MQTEYGSIPVSAERQVARPIETTRGLAHSLTARYTVGMAGDDRLQATVVLDDAK